MKRFPAACLGLVTITCMAQGIRDNTETWSFDECVNYALSHNTDLNQSRLAGEITQSNLAEAKAQWQPSLDFGTTHNFTNTPWGEAKKNIYTGNFTLGASWSVWNGGIRQNNIRLQELQKDVDALTTEDLERTIKTRLLSAYLNILYSEESAGIYENALEVSTANASRGYELWQAGRLSRVDWAQLKAQQEQDNYNLVNARGECASRRLELKNLLQLGIDRNITPAPLNIDSVALLAALPPLDETYSLACAQDPQLTSLALRDNMADVSLKIAKGNRMPQIGLNAGIAAGYAVPEGHIGADLRRSLNEQIGVSLTLPIFDRRKTTSAVEKARYEKTGVGYDTDARLQELASTVEQWYIDTTEACSRFRAAESQENAARLSNELVNEQFNLGLVNTIELLTAHNALLDAAHSTLQAKYIAILGRSMINFYRTSEITL